MLFFVNLISGQFSRPRKVCLRIKNFLFGLLFSGGGGDEEREGVGFASLDFERFFFAISFSFVSNCFVSRPGTTFSRSTVRPFHLGTAGNERHPPEAAAAAAAAAATRLVPKWWHQNQPSVTKTEILEIESKLLRFSNKYDEAGKLF